MNLQFIDFVIKANQGTFPQGDLDRLSFFRGLWEEMNRWSEALDTAEEPYAAPPAEELEAAWANDRPVFSFAAPQIKKDRFAAICGDLREYVCNRAGLAEEDAQALREVDFGSLVRQEELELAGNDPEAFIGGLFSNACEQEVPSVAAHMVAMIGMMALRVDFEPAAQAVLEGQRAINKMNRNPLTCPVCGGSPALAKVGGESPTEGRGRTLYCQQCGTEWEFERVRCARCGTKNPQHLHYFNIEGDDAHRIHKCDECNGYIRTVFVEDALRPFSYEVEEVVTAKLDAIARDPKFQAQG